MSLAQRAGSVIMPIASQVDAAGALAAGGYGGVILMGSNGVIDGTGSGGPAQVSALVKRLQAQRFLPAGPPLLIGVDQEYGDVARLTNGFTAFPGASVIASATPTDDAVVLTEQVAAAAAAEMRAVGITVDFAPDADVVADPDLSAIGNRSYGSDPQQVGRFVAAAVRGYQSGGVAATMKHFPGIGSITADTHVDLPSLEVSCATWNATDAVPMRAGARAGVALAMTGHVYFPAVGADRVPASISTRIVTDLLRGKGYGECAGIGFRGVTVTDSMQMQPITDGFGAGEAAWRAVAAGQDLLLMPLDPVAARQGIIDAVADGRLPAGRLAEAATQVLALRIALSRSPQPGMDVINSPAHQALAERARGGG